MIALIISVCALVLAAAASVGVVWTILSIQQLGEEGDALKALCELRSKQLEAAVERTTGSKLAAELDSLRGALDVIRASNRKEFGALWGRMGGRSAPSDAIDVPPEDYTDDPEIAALLRFQNAPHARGPAA